MFQAVRVEISTALNRVGQIPAASAEAPPAQNRRADPEVTCKNCGALSDVLRRRTCLKVIRLPGKYSTRERMAEVLDRLEGQQFVPFVVCSPQANWV
jgi:segregation and condensation protein A